MRPPREWAGLRTRRLGCISAAVVLTLALVLTALSSASLIFFIGLCDIAVVVMVAARIRLHKWPCPRCLRPFSVKDVWSREWPFTDRCRHCGFPAWAHVPSRTTLPATKPKSSASESRARALWPQQNYKVVWHAHLSTVSRLSSDARPSVLRFVFASLAWVSAIALYANSLFDLAAAPTARTGR